MDGGYRQTSDDSQTLVSARESKCGAVENLRVSTMGFLSTLSGRISSVLDEAGCLCMDEDGAQSRRKSRRRPVITEQDAEDPPLFPGGSAQGASSTASGQPTPLQLEGGDRREALVDELASLYEVQDEAVSDEDVTRIVKQLVRQHMENDGLDKDGRRALEAAVLAKVPRTGQSVPHRTLCESIVIALDQLALDKLGQEELLEELIAVMNLELHEKMIASACKKSAPPSSQKSEMRIAEEAPGTNAAPMRWVRHELSVIPERGESTFSKESFAELVPKHLASKEVSNAF